MLNSLISWDHLYDLLAEHDIIVSTKDNKIVDVENRSPEKNHMVTHFSGEEVSEITLDTEDFKLFFKKEDAKITLQIKRINDDESLSVTTYEER